MYCRAKEIMGRRVKMGELSLDESLEEGQCREITPDELILIKRK